MKIKFLVNGRDVVKTLRLMLIDGVFFALGMYAWRIRGYFPGWPVWVFLAGLVLLAWLFNRKG